MGDILSSYFVIYADIVLTIQRTCVNGLFYRFFKLGGPLSFKTEIKQFSGALGTHQKCSLNPSLGCFSFSKYCQLKCFSLQNMFLFNAKVCFTFHLIWFSVHHQKMANSCREKNSGVVCSADRTHFLSNAARLRSK